jgi:GNAT superfamily N-acetyltransferase
MIEAWLRENQRAPAAPTDSRCLRPPFSLGEPNRLMYEILMSGPASQLDGCTGPFTFRLALPSELDVLNDIDGDASTLYAQYGLPIELGQDHVFARAEQARWLRSTELGRAFLAVDRTGIGVGFAALDVVDGEPYLDQLAVRVAAMRQGIGGRLLARSADWARETGASSIWLTTYDHLPFNRPYYERHGYGVMPEEACSAGVRHHIRDQQRYLPAPTQRVAMRRPI